MPCVKQNNIPQVPKGREDLAERVREVLKCQAFWDSHYKVMD